MLFNSYPFLLGFFPASLLAFAWSRRLSVEASLAVLLTASMFFYAWWNIALLPLLLGSIVSNYLCGRAIHACAARGRQAACTVLLVGGIGLNLGVLAGFKYLAFAADNLNLLLDTSFVVGQIILPLGISFFTFEQISFLIDVRQGRTQPADLLRYALFVSFFPRLVAGPILRYNEIVPQLADRDRASIGGTPGMGGDLAVGLTIFVIGLAKKTLLADGIAPYATTAFAAAGQGQPVDLLVAWGGALAYTFQLYFDFSGYSDMAIGAARCFGIRFPMNFFSPYKATSIIEFWRRWHITLSRFLRDYLYVGLGGNRRGATRRYVNLMLTMLIGGLWHGASWTFVAWGGLHGAYLMINHGWIALTRRTPAVPSQATRTGNFFGWAVTFAAVVVGWVFFRAPDFTSALNMLAGMGGLHGVTIPAGLASALAPVQGILDRLGIPFGEGSGTRLVATWLWIGGLMGIALFCPSTQQIVARGEPVLDRAPDLGPPAGWLRFLGWAPSPQWAVAIGVLAFLGVISITRVSEFLYWQF